MKKILLTTAVLLSLLVAALPRASAVTLYSATWGTTNGFAGGNGTLVNVGWTAVAVTETTGPYLGIYQATGASDPVNGIALPQNTVYFTFLLPAQTNAGMFYTVDGAGVGSNGDMPFTQFDPSLYTNLTFSVQVRANGSDASNYFAIQIAGQWYVSTNRIVDTGNFAYPQFSYFAMLYRTNAAAWRLLTINTTDVTIGGTPGADLSGNITGIGIVEEPTGGGFDYNQILINQGAIPPTPAAITSQGINQTVFAGGGATFATTTAGTAVLRHRWETNGVILQAGGRYLGTTNNTLTITNINADDALTSYTLIVTNFTGGATNNPRSLTVNPRPAGILYAEMLPYVGPSGNLPLAGVGWAQSVFATSRGIFQNGVGLGIFFDFSTPAATNAYFTTVTNDVGLSGLPFVELVPENYPALTIQARFAPGNAAGTVAGNCRVYWMVRMSGTWYSSVNFIQTSLTQNQYDTNQLAFSRAATNWNNLTIVGNTVTIGGPAGGALTGNIDGAGLVFVHTASGASMNFQEFLITTNAVVIPPPLIGANYPIDRGVSSGGGASFGVAASGGQPFTYGWTTNGVAVGNGGRVSGATTPTLTIRNLTTADDQMQIIAFVTNSVGFDRSDTLLGQPTVLTVTNGPIGILYSEDIPFVGPATGNYPIGSIGWSEAVPGSPFTVFRRGTAGTLSQGDGAVFAFLGNPNTPNTNIYYTSRTTDTNQSGLPFPDINLASYPDLSISVEIAPTFAPANVTAYFAVQLDGGPWYVSTSALPTPGVASPAYSIYTQPFSPTAANWKSLTIGGTTATIGAPAASDLSGAMTGVGLVFVTVGTGGTLNFDNLVVNATGLGGLNLSQLSSSSVTLSWVGNPAVAVQSNTNLLSPAGWQLVPNTKGAFSIPAPFTGPQRFYRLYQP